MSAILPRKVMVVDDDADLRDAVCQALVLEGLDPTPVADGQAALNVLGTDYPGIVLADLRMPGMDGLTLFARLQALDPDLPVIILTGHGDIMTAVDLMRSGAYDFIAKPFTSDSLLPSVQRALEKRALVLENRRLRRSIGQDEAGGLVGESRAIEHARTALRQLAQADVPVLVLGETGTGKSLAATILHKRSERARHPLVTIDCASLPAGGAGALLFGQASGAGPGVHMPRTGQLRRAQRGSVLLDQLERLPADLQGLLAAVIESRAATPVGSEIPVQLDCRFMATAAPQLPDLLKAGSFDATLYYRAAGYILELPPLRARREDIVPLFRSFLADAAEQAGRDVPMITASVWKRLQDHDWPGNVRELKSYAESIALGLTPPGSDLRGLAHPMADGLKETVTQFEAELIRQALFQCQGDIAATLEILKLPRKTFYDKLSRHAISPTDYR